MTTQEERIAIQCINQTIESAVSAIDVAIESGAFNIQQIAIIIGSIDAKEIYDYVKAQK